MTKESSGPAFPAVGRMVDENTFQSFAEGGMSLRAYAAIKLRVPDSGIYWLDEMIQKSRQERRSVSGHVCVFVSVLVALAACVVGICTRQAPTIDNLLLIGLYFAVVGPILMEDERDDA